MAAIATVSNKHEAIMNHLIANPAMKLGEVATYFGVSQPWLSTLIHSDAFQLRLKQKHEMLFGLSIAPVAEKLNHLAHKAIDRLEEVLAAPQPARLLLDTAKFATDAISFSGKASPSPQAPRGGDTFIIDATLLRAARERILSSGNGVRRPELIEHEANDSAPAEGVQTSGER